MRHKTASRPARQRAPTHPGEILREDVLPALNLSVAEASRQLRVTRQTLHRILSGRSGVSAEMAVRLGRFCGNGPGLWLRMQQNHDLWHAEQGLRKELKKIPAHAIA
jgi:addiction module HigA family antidote